MTWRLLFTLGLLVHGGIVAGQASGVPTSWMIGGSGRSIGGALTIAAAVLTIAAAVMLLLHGSTWRTLAVLGACLSLVFFVVFFQPLIIFGLALDVAIIVAIGYFAWPTKAMVGA